MKYSNNPNFKLWVMLAMMPIVLLVGVLAYLSYALDDGFILETDPTSGVGIEQSIVMNTYDREFENVMNPLDIEREQKRSTSILDTKSKRAVRVESLPTEEIKIIEKRKIDKNGKPVQVRVQEAETLESMSEKYLGHKVFWCYLQDINYDKINEAGGLKQGMALFLPDTAYYKINPKDQVSLKMALEEVRKIQPDAYPEMEIAAE